MARTKRPSSTSNVGSSSSSMTRNASGRLRQRLEGSSASPAPVESAFYNHIGKNRTQLSPRWSLSPVYHLAARIWTPPDLSRDSSPRVLRVGCGRISGLSVEGVVLLAIMDSRAPRANRGAGVTRQGCYRPDAVSGRPKGHGFRHSLRTPGGKGFPSVRLPLPACTGHPWSRPPRRSVPTCWRPQSSPCCGRAARGGPVPIDARR